MVRKKINVLWTNTAKEQLKQIYNYYKPKSLQGANNVKNDILKAGKDLVFSEQYQPDEIEPNYRRIIVRNYKLIYVVEKERIVILRIFNTKQSPDNQINNI